MCIRDRCHIVRCGPNRQCLEFGDDLPSHLIDFSDELDLVAPKFHTKRIVGIRREDIEGIAAHAECSALQVVVVAIVLDIDELHDELVAILLDFLIQEHGHACIFSRRTDTVDARYRSDHDHIAPRE